MQKKKILFLKYIPTTFNLQEFYKKEVYFSVLLSFRLELPQ